VNAVDLVILRISVSCTEMLITDVVHTRWVWRQCRSGDIASLMDSECSRSAL